jgi:hypothetical protein
MNVLELAARAGFEVAEVSSVTAVVSDTVGDLAVCSKLEKY